jgi:hypothetical protein
MSKEKIGDRSGGPEIAPDGQLSGQLSEAQLGQVLGGVVVRAPIIVKKPPPTTTVGWSGTPYQPEEDVEAY